MRENLRIKETIVETKSPVLELTSLIHPSKNEQTSASHKPIWDQDLTLNMLLLRHCPFMVHQLKPTALMA